VAGGADAKTTTFAMIRIQSLKVVIVDSVLGLHLPLAQVCMYDSSGDGLVGVWMLRPNMSYIPPSSHS
jgi:hypothetical protein